ncbi:MAG: AAA family ATPase [Cardiobacteriaceae bacterium]|nr:AAA family ATPase [Cardiobacteriaceae bacterium]
MSIIPADLHQKLTRALEQMNQIVVGKPEVILHTLCCLLARGHVLLEDLPGAGKTTLAKAFAATLSLDFRRIQFTSDLLPADVIGFSLLDPQTHQLKFQKGAVFTQLLLADEINRASPKSQSALLEAMEERQVSVERQTLPLPKPFFVIATQNPLEQVGTFALPESQLDRFIMRLSMGYPSAKQEMALLRGQSRDSLLSKSKALLSEQDIVMLQSLREKIHISEAVAHYTQKLLHETRHCREFTQGLSTRGGLALIHAAQALALIEGKDAVYPEHIQRLFPLVAWHRVRGTASHDSQHQQALLSVLGRVAVPL